jgi:hypothetical protein
MVKNATALPEDGLVFLAIKRESVEKCETGFALDKLDLLMEPGNIGHYAGSLLMFFEGYDDDPRELFEVSEVRRYVTALDAKFPYWFYFIFPDFSQIMMLFYCLCGARMEGPSQASSDPKMFEAFLHNHFEAVNTLAQRGLITADNVTEATDRIERTLCGSMEGNPEHANIC